MVMKQSKISVNKHNIAFSKYVGLLRISMYPQYNQCVNQTYISIDDSFFVTGL